MKLGEAKKAKPGKSKARGAKGKAAKRKARKKAAKGGEPLDLRPVEAELVRAARETRRPDLKARMVSLVGRLESVAAAATIVALASGDPAAGGADELRPAAVLALTAMGENDKVRRWLAKTAFDQALDNAGQLIVVTETAGRLGLSDARRWL